MKGAAWYGIAVLSICVVQNSLAWGEGHTLIARRIAAELGLTNVTAFAQFNHLPDSFAPFDESLVGRVAIDFLKTNGCTRRYDMHADKGRALAFCLLVEAIREKNELRQLYWLGCLAHSTADMAACNHDPVVHLATYGWCCKAWGMTTSSGHAYADIARYLELGHVERFTVSGAYVAAATPATVLLQIMLDSTAGVDVCAQHGYSIWQHALACVDQQQGREALDQELSVLGSWAVVRAVAYYRRACVCAQAGTVVELTPAVLAEYEKKMDDFVQTRALSADRYTAVAGAGPATLGVVLEPCWRMNEGMFGFNDRVLAVQIAVALKAELIDVRSLRGDTLKRFSVVIVPAQRCVHYRGLSTHAVDAALAAYREAGGKIIWIGGGVPLKSVAAPLPMQAWKKMEIVSCPQTINGTACVRDVVTAKAGWCWPANTLVLDAAQTNTVIPLVERPEGLAGFAYPRTAPSVAYIPSYAVFPYIWTDEKPAGQLALDRFGQALLMDVVKRLCGSVTHE